MNAALKRLRAVLEAPGCGKTLAASMEWTDSPAVVCGVGPNDCGECLEAKRVRWGALDAFGSQMLALVELTESARRDGWFDHDKASVELDAFDAEILNLLGEA